MGRTEELFREDSYLRECEARVTGVNDLGGVVLDRTVFYPTGGGQPGDKGALILDSGRQIDIATALYDKDSGDIIHVPSDPPEIEPGEKVSCALNWERRHAHMRVHTCLHLLCALLPYSVTGGSIGEGEGRLDFDIPEAGLDKEALTQELNRLVESDAAISVQWITEQELDSRPELVRTMAVSPPRGSGKVRLVEIAGIDLQPCGGTHVATTGEIGPATVTKIEKKGAQNRRIRIRLN